MEEIELEICEKCGKKEGAWVIDPYIDEVYDEQVLKCLCDNCFQESLWDI
jgi:hypothetical protein